MFDASKKFKDYALSCSGHNGGDIDGKYWFCGIEPGGELIDFSELKPVIDIPNCDLYNKWQMSHKVEYLIKIISSDSLKNATTYKDVGWFFANLYPLPFKQFSNSHWKKEHTDYTGFFTKDEYKIWCQQYRFPKIYKMTQVGQFKTIICSGVDCRVDFLMAFCPSHLLKHWIFNKGEIKNISVGNKTKNIEIININQCNINKIIITPFFGQWGINSKKEIDNLSHILNDLL